jgi:hypothetical protein
MQNLVKKKKHMLEIYCKFIFNLSNYLRKLQAIADFGLRCFSSKNGFKKSTQKIYRLNMYTL